MTHVRLSSDEEFSKEQRSSAAGKRLLISAHLVQSRECMTATKLSLFQQFLSFADITDAFEMWSITMLSGRTLFRRIY